MTASVPDADRLPSLIDDFEETARRDPIGHRVHTALAMLYCFSVALAQAPEGISIALLVGCALVRLRVTWRLYPKLLRQPIAIAFTLWSMWHALSVLWSPDIKQGLDEVQDFRVLFVVSAMWPVLRRLPLYVASLLAGAVVQNVGQVFQLVAGVHSGGGIVRLGGLLHAIQVGALLAAAMVWHLGPALLSRGGWRLASWVGFALSMGGLILSGSRGPWLSALVSVPLAATVLAMRFKAARWPVLIMVIAVAAVGFLMWPRVSGQITRRVSTAKEELRLALEEGRYDSDVGSRIKNNEWALRFFTEQPIHGAGAGSFRSRVLASSDYPELVARFPATPATFFAQGHPHSTYLHVLSSTGIVGAVLCGLTIVFTWWRAARDRLDHAYAPMHLFVLIGWLVGAAFDCYDLNAHEFGLFALLVTFTLAQRPRLTGPAPAIGRRAGGTPALPDAMKARSAIE